MIVSCWRLTNCQHDHVSNDLQEGIMRWFLSAGSSQPAMIPPLFQIISPPLSFLSGQSTLRRSVSQQHPILNARPLGPSKWWAVRRSVRDLRENWRIVNFWRLNRPGLFTVTDQTQRLPLSVGMCQNCPVFCFNWAECSESPRIWLSDCLTGLTVLIAGAELLPRHPGLQQGRDGACQRPGRVQDKVQRRTKICLQVKYLANNHKYSPNKHKYYLWS